MLDPSFAQNAQGCRRKQKRTPKHQQVGKADSALALKQWEVGEEGSVVMTLPDSRSISPNRLAVVRPAGAHDREGKLLQVADTANHGSLCKWLLFHA